MRFVDKIEWLRESWLTQNDPADAAGSINRTSNYLLFKWVLLSELSIFATGCRIAVFSRIPSREVGKGKILIPCIVYPLSALFDCCVVGEVLNLRLANQKRVDSINLALQAQLWRQFLNVWIFNKTLLEAVL